MEMQSVVICYRPSSVVCLSVRRSVTVVSPAKTAEPIEMPFGIWTRVGPRKHDRGPELQIPRSEGELLGGTGKDNTVLL